MSCNRIYEPFQDAIETTDITELQKKIIKQRYITVVNIFSKRCCRLSYLYHSMRVIITVGSLFVPALLSIQYTSANELATHIYWTTWTISLLVTISNGILSVFKIDKKYFFLHTTLEQLRSEGWQYLQLSGRYSGFYTPNEVPTHINQFTYFCHIVEKIKMKQVEEEYYKFTDIQQSSQQVSSKQPDAIPLSISPSLTKQRNTSYNNTDRILPPTPLKSYIDNTKNLPSELLSELYSVSSAKNEQKRRPQSVIPTFGGSAGNLIGGSSPPNIKDTLQYYYSGTVLNKRGRSNSSGSFSALDSSPLSDIKTKETLEYFPDVNRRNSAPNKVVEKLETIIEKDSRVHTDDETPP